MGARPRPRHAVVELPDPRATTAGAMDLFDGKSLGGWEGDANCWRARDGAIGGKSSGSSGSKTDTYLYTKAAYQNFILNLDFKFLTGNSGVLFRAESGPDFGLRGAYEADIFSPNAIGKLAYEDKVLFRPDAALPLRFHLSVGQCGSTR